MRKMWKNFNLALSFIRGFLYLSYFLNSHLTVSLLAISLSFRGGFFVAFRRKPNLDNWGKKSLDNYNCRCPNPLIRFCTKRLIQHRWGFHVRSFLMSQTRLELPTSCERSALPARASHIRVLGNVYINIKHLLACLISEPQMACFNCHLRRDAWGGLCNV